MERVGAAVVVVALAVAGLAGCGGGAGEMVDGSAALDDRGPGWVALGKPQSHAGPVGDGRRVAMLGWDERGRFRETVSVLVDEGGAWRELPELPFEGDGIWNTRLGFLGDGRLVLGASVCSRGYVQDSGSAFCEGAWRYEFVTTSPDGRRWSGPVGVATVHDDDPSSDAAMVLIVADGGPDLVLHQQADAGIFSGDPGEVLEVDPDDGSIRDRTAGGPGRSCRSEDGRLEIAPAEVLGAEPAVVAVRAGDEVGRFDLASLGAVEDVHCADGGVLTTVEVDGARRSFHLDLTAVVTAPEVAPEPLPGGPWAWAGDLVRSEDGTTTALAGDPTARLPELDLGGLYGEVFDRPALDPATVRLGEGVVACWDVSVLGDSRNLCYYGSPSPDGSGREVPRGDLPPRFEFDE